jgi:hypothetical protein
MYMNATVNCFMKKRIFFDGLNGLVVLGDTCRLLVTEYWSGCLLDVHI